MVTVFLVDDHEVVRRGLIDLLSADPEVDVIGEAGSVAQAMAQIPALRPDVAVLDVRLPDGKLSDLRRTVGALVKYFAAGNALRKQPGPQIVRWFDRG